MSKSRFNKLKSRKKNGTEVTLNLSSNLIGNSNNETNFPIKILLTETQVSKIRKVFANGSAANIKFSRIVRKIANKADKEEYLFNKKVSLNDMIKTANTSKYILKDLKNVFGAGKTLKKNKRKEIIKVIKSLENRGMLLKGTTTNINS